MASIENLWQLPETALVEAYEAARRRYAEKKFRATRSAHGSNGCARRRSRPRPAASRSGARSSTARRIWRARARKCAR